MNLLRSLEVGALAVDKLVLLVAAGDDTFSLDAGDIGGIGLEKGRDERLYMDS
jgi:hypothetical protein